MILSRFAFVLKSKSIFLNMVRQKIIFFFFFIVFSQTIFSQFYTLPNSWVFQQIQDFNLLSADTSLPTNVYPFNPLVYSSFSDKDTNYRLFKYIKNDPALDILFEKDVVHIQQKDFSIRINPLINFLKGKQTGDTSISIFTNTRGFIASAKWSNIYIETLLSENQSVFSDYLYNYSKSTQIVPGQGRWKNFKASGFDYAFSGGLVSFQAHRNVNVSIGTGKQKIGNGYRSLFLSDNSFVYPFVKIEQNWWKGRFYYVCTYAFLNNLVSASINIPPYTERLFQKKPFVYQYLNIGLTKKMRMGLFQSIIGESPDTKNVWRGDGILFSPVIFSQLMYYNWQNKNNVLAGMDLQYKVFKTLLLYSQLVVDDIDGFKNDDGYGYQIGLKYLEKWNDWRLSILTEWNDVKKTTYSAPLFDTYSNSSYSHFNQNLAFTINNGKEWVTQIFLKKQRWVFNGQWNIQMKKTYWTTMNDVNYYKLLFGFVVNPSYNLILNLGLENRFSNINTQCIYIQLHTSLYNIYYDF